MTIDLSQFKQTFIEESDEGLDVLESGLLALDSGTADEEVIHAVFRAAHSIKGGAGTFGLNEIANFTHVMETLLDEMRDGRRAISKEGINVLLDSVDVLRELMDAARDDVDPEMSRANEVKGLLDALLASGAESDNTKAESTETESADELVAATESDGQTASASSGWHIKFHPHEHMLRTGNDTVRMFKELASLGDMENTVDFSDLPELVHMDPELSYLSWNIALKNNPEQGDIEKATIEEIFEWVDDDCDLSIEALVEDSQPEAVVENKLETQVEEKKEEAKPTPVTDNVTPIEAPLGQKKLASKKKKAAAEGGSIRVGTDKVDTLINMVGELVITQSMLSQMGDEFSMDKLEDLREGLAQLERNTRELQESVMRIRMLPISFSFQRFPRLVHDLSQKMDKKIELKMTGEQTELDKTVMEKIGDPLVHLVRNSLDHGIESPEVRLANGKSEVGTINLNAYHQGGFIMIEIIDDGAGLPKDKLLAKAIEKGLVSPNETITDEKIYDLIFHPGFSTADQVTDVSGRGVGMDVVRKNIKELGGNVDVSTEPGKGTKFTIRLPLTLAILDGQLIKVGNETYIIPLVSIIESLEIQTENINTIAGTTEVYKMRDEYIPLVRLYEIFDVEPLTTRLQECLLVVVEGDGGKAGILVDDLLSQQQVVIKSLETNYKRLQGISGATILGDGTVALILDMSGLLSMAKEFEPEQSYANG
ncbi:chemotaxis protein CheA [sulfur-oxidizing endosymbiont of Gigantopelta aegis]|uniref:chemotaxis protein CheA n=1 Tax=sulfur-oxidizing endosymbiont of Gigantopelta aegis TaxID=2794934 RepID=UPI0018DC13F9|nr:chemotaxis protein CheA [sulfur-oxidizing endosymbiont of Gigantopelta aegis]